MTAPLTQAPELVVQTWFNTDRPLTLATLRGRVVVLRSISGAMPEFGRLGDSSSAAHP